ncbi:MAG: hypothetical protein E7566_01255 [Ruminococcaceae bacterium]|nr:hypothetical protein [Oscillospiraceae bacterium]
MKNRFRSFICIILVMAFCFSVFPFSASASEDFVIENGVLKSYKGSATSVIIPSAVYSIADNAFSGNTKVKSVNLNNVSVIGNEAFKGCTSLDSVSGYDNVTACGAYAFFATPFLINYDKTDLVMGTVLVNSKAKGSYTIPSNVEAVAPYALSGNTAVTSVTIPDGVTSIGEGAFYNCSGLKSVSVSSQVSYIGPFAFEGTSYLKSNTNEFLVLGNGILVKYSGASATPKVPDTVKQIAAGAFYNNTKLTSVTLPANLSGIGMRAFAGCTALKDITLPNNLLLLDKEAFSGCTALESVKIPVATKILGESVFFGCTKLKTAHILSDAEISRGMFANCTALKSVMISSETESIGELAFYNCSSLAEISIPDTVKKIDDTAFKGVSKLSVYCKLNAFAANELKDRGFAVNQIGDANMDTKLNIKDATHIQKATAGLLTLDFSSQLRADVDFNGTVNVKDATWIQKKLAGIV